MRQPDRKPVEYFCTTCRQWFHEDTAARHTITPLYPPEWGVEAKPVEVIDVCPLCTSGLLYEPNVPHVRYAAER